MLIEAVSAESPRQSPPLLAPPQSFAARMRVALAAILRLSERLAESVVSAYERIFCLDARDTAEIYMHVGSDMARSGRIEDAVTALQRTLAIEPSNGQAWFQLGAVHLRQKACGAALEAFERARSCGLDRLELHYLIGEALSDLERHEEAVAALRRALEQEPRLPEALYRLGVSLDKLRRYAEAAEAFRAAIEQAPREVTYYQSLGFTLESMGKREEAIECFKRAVELERRTRA